MRKSLVALDTNHIKEYVFSTNKLKEIRGASSLLDYHNRAVMEKIAREVDASLVEKCLIYANGGSGLFLIDADKADLFGKKVQNALREVTGGGASITYVVQELPEDAPENVDALWKYPLGDTLELMRYRLREAKNSPEDVIALPSHPFMRPCDACGIEYASPDEKGKIVSRDPGEENELYCVSCQKKRLRDDEVKRSIKWYIEVGKQTHEDYDHLWGKLTSGLRRQGYSLQLKPERPNNFNVFRNFKGAKDYIGLIYADANGMGRKIEACETLAELNKFAKDVEEAVYEAVCVAIAKHLKIEDHVKPRNELVDPSQEHIFPFDVLLLGGDDIMMVVPASDAMDVALTVAKEFHRLTLEKQRKDPKSKKEAHTLSVGVVLSPIKYPFGLLRKLVESTLNFAKTEGAKKALAGQKSAYGDTLINFMTVTGSTSLDFKRVYGDLSSKKVSVSVNGRSQDAAFYATLRPYTPEQLEILLNAVREGNKRALGRTKLHQVREAVLKKNLTTSVGEGLAVLRNWRAKQREYVMQHIYTLGGMYQETYKSEQNPASLFPRVTFPWFVDGDKTYRTSLLDFVELYDFVAREEGAGDDEG